MNAERSGPAAHDVEVQRLVRDCCEMVAAVSGGGLGRYIGQHLRQCRNKGTVETPAGPMCKRHARAAGHIPNALFGPVGRHPWVNEAGKVDAAKAGTWMANIILMAGGSPKTAFACALEVVTDITDNPAKFKDFEPWANDQAVPSEP